MRTLLIVTTWLASGPQVWTQQVENLADCRTAAAAISGQFKAQALSNLTGPSATLSIAVEDGNTVVRTPLGREVARLSCASLGR